MTTTQKKYVLSSMSDCDSQPGYKSGVQTQKHVHSPTAAGIEPRHSQSPRRHTNLSARILNVLKMFNFKTSLKVRVLSGGDEDEPP